MFLAFPEPLWDVYVSPHRGTVPVLTLGQKSPSTDMGWISPLSRTDEQFVTGSGWFQDGDNKWVPSDSSGHPVPAPEISHNPVPTLGTIFCPVQTWGKICTMSVVGLFCHSVSNGTVPCRGLTYMSFWINILDKKVSRMLCFSENNTQFLLYFLCTIQKEEDSSCLLIKGHILGIVYLKGMLVLGSHNLPPQSKNQHAPGKVKPQWGKIAVRAKLMNNLVFKETCGLWEHETALRKRILF